MNVHSGAGNLNFAGKLNEQIYMFGLQLGDADTAPTEQQLTTYRAMHERLGRLLSEWKALTDTDIPRLDERIKSSKRATPN